MIENSSENELFTVINDMPGGLCVFNFIDKYPYIEETVWNKYMEKITGFSREEINRTGIFYVCSIKKEQDSIIKAFKNIVDLIENITLSVAQYIECQGMSLLFDTNVEEKTINCDADKLERIVLNLISNAVKFSKSGDSIFVNLMDTEEKVIISVKDTGIGIAEENQSLIFDRFVQVDKSFARNREGSGIGLSLVKSMVEMHNGTIEVKSQLNKGSEFIITLPAKLAEEKSEITDTRNYLICDNVKK